VSRERLYTVHVVGFALVDGGLEKVEINEGEMEPVYSMTFVPKK